MNEFSEEILESNMARIVSPQGVICQYPVRDSHRFLSKSQIDALLSELNNLQERLEEECPS